MYKNNFILKYLAGHESSVNILPAST